MEISNLIILGKSEATLTMILDNLDSRGYYPTIQMVNNLALPIERAFAHPAFSITILNSYVPTQTDMLFLGVFQPEVKQKVMTAFGQRTQQFLTLIHATASISATTHVGYGCLINSHVSVAAQSHVGNFVSLNRNVSVGHHTVVEDFVTVNPGCNIAGNVRIGQGTQIGMGANLLDGITVGTNTIIGAGSVVTRSIPDNVVAYGSPARVIRSR
jgi:sugar O-acyltransferase (sialic acid O-acetyltransferase NeuD family)